MGNKSIDDITGERFGRLKAIRPTDWRCGTNVVWECRCDCGSIHYASASDLKSGNTRSCGCLRRETSAARAANRETLDNGTDLALLNQKVGRNSRSGVKGVSWDNRKGRWRAQITFRGRRYDLGRFVDLEDAAAARREAERELFDPILAAHGMPSTRETV